MNITFPHYQFHYLDGQSKVFLIDKKHLIISQQNITKLPGECFMLFYLHVLMSRDLFQFKFDNWKLIISVLCL